MSEMGKRDLMAIGTRYDHYMELKEIFMVGVETVKNMRTSHRTQMDDVIKHKLDAAVEMIDKQICYLSDFSVQDQSGSQLDRELYAIERERVSTPKLLKAATDEPQDSRSIRPEENSST